MHPPEVSVRLKARNNQPEPNRAQEQREAGLYRLLPRRPRTRKGALPAGGCKVLLPL